MDHDPQNEPTLCGAPCPPEQACDGCVEYWQRMEHEGLWNRVGHHWTDKGWREITK